MWCLRCQMVARKGAAGRGSSNSRLNRLLKRGDRVMSGTKRGLPPSTGPPGCEKSNECEAQDQQPPPRDRLEPHGPPSCSPRRPSSRGGHFCGDWPGSLESASRTRRRRFSFCFYRVPRDYHRQSTLKPGHSTAILCAPLHRPMIDTGARTFSMLPTDCMSSHERGAGRYELDRINVLG